MPVNPTAAGTSSSFEIPTKPVNEPFAKLTKEALARHTREQDESYIIEILRQVQRPLKKIAESPQNIFAQAPNVFSRNDYEPAVKKQKGNDQHEQSTQQNQENSSRLLKEINKNQSNDRSSGSGENDLTDGGRSKTGPYANVINDIDCDNPQEFHDSFNKNLQLLSRNKEMEFGVAKKSDKTKETLLNVESSPEHGSTLDELKIKVDLDKSLKHSSTANTSLDECITNTNLVGTNTNSTHSNNNNTNTNRTHEDDFISFWRQCIKRGSTIVKRLKESENLLRLVSSRSLKLKDLEFKLENQENEVLNVELEKKNNYQASVTKHLIELKKSLYIVASLLNINTDIGVEESLFDSNKIEILDMCLNKVTFNLLSFALLIITLQIMLGYS